MDGLTIVDKHSDAHNHILRNLRIDPHYRWFGTRYLAMRYMELFWRHVDDEDKTVAAFYYSMYLTANAVFANRSHLTP